MERRRINFMATKKQILTELKERLVNDLRVKNENKKHEDPKGEYIWVGGPDGLVGNSTCHYEFIFQDDETLSLEVHFEEKKNCEEFKDVLSKNDNETLEFTNWGNKDQHKRIIGKNDNYCVQINQNSNVGEIVNSAIELLEELDDSIGYSLAKKCDELKQKPSLSKRNGTVVNAKEYKKRFINYKKSFHTKHGSIQEALITKLASKYNVVGFERTLSDIRVDVIGINKNGKTDEKEYTYDIYEVKPYDSPTDCIREALGQLIYYKYQFEKKYKVGKLFVVGQNKLGFFDRQYLEKIHKSLPNLEINYITPN